MVDAEMSDPSHAPPPGATPQAAAAALEALVVGERRAVVASLARRLGDLDLAEDAFQDAAAEALRSWPGTGVPERPGAWLLTVGRRRAVDRVRRDTMRVDREAVAARMEARIRDGDVPDRDDQLALMLTCCHPALAVDAQVALTLRSVAGLATAEIARAFLVPEPTMAQRLVRAKRKIARAGIPFTVPQGDARRERLAAVASVIYLVFNEGYTATSGTTLVRGDLCEEAIRLARLLVGLVPGDDEAVALLTLLLITDARRPTRLDEHGDLVLLEDQDRTRWRRDRLDEAAALLEIHGLPSEPGAYRLQAEISRLHAVAPSFDATDWSRIVALYDRLARVTASPVVFLNRAVAVAMAQGPEAGLALVDALVDDGVLEDYALLHATRADLLRRVGRPEDAAGAYRAALVTTANEAERRFLEARLAEVVPTR